ncbi:MAG TPA: hypothetical protein VLT87_22630, partial [Thermoanaerobaculia bacterium]|nr:hypothetical protein [Thermoanaerobaculia bacterium]
MLRKPLAEPGAQIVCRNLARHERHEPFAAGPFRNDHRRLPHGGVSGDGRLHLARLDAEAPDLHLVVQPPQ